MIKIVFFDFDGVLTTDFSGTETICGILRKPFPELSLETMVAAYRKHCGHLLKEPGTFADVWENFCQEIGKNVSSASLQHALVTVPKNGEMFELVHTLREKYRVGIITDNAVERMALLDKSMHLSDVFDPIVVSGSVHALKHDRTTVIFDAALEAAHADPTECVFIDNQERNLVTPAGMGMKTYWHDDTKNNVAALRSTLEQWGIDLS